MTPFGSTQFFVTPNAVEYVDDWSRVRSPSRARRRMAKYRQNIQKMAKPAAYQFGGAIHIHPELYRELKRQIGGRP